jgi:signal transduction histidine kinase
MTQARRGVAVAGGWAGAAARAVRGLCTRLLHGPPALQVWDGAVAFGLAAAGLWYRPADPFQYLVACGGLILIPRAPAVLTTTIALVAGASFANAAGGGAGYVLALYWCLPVVVAAYQFGVRLRASWLPLPAAASLLGTLWLGVAPLPLCAVILGGLVGLARQGQLRSIWLRNKLEVTEQAVSVMRTEQVSLEERAALARELHDIVGHHVTAVVIQAEAAQCQPEPDQHSWARVAESARAALTELDTLVSALRHANATSLTTSPRGLGDLHELLDSLRASGVTPSLDVEVHTDVPQGLQLTAYRIVQEAVTNILRHADATAASIMIKESGDGLSIVVDDDGSGFNPETVKRGRGLLGIGERVAISSGTWSVQPSPSGGTRVRVELPLNGRARRTPR